MSLDSIKNIFPFSVGCTSCVYPNTALYNVEAIAPFVDDIELMFFEEPKRDNFPSKGDFLQIKSLLDRYQTGCTVHLPVVHCHDLMKNFSEVNTGPLIEVIEKSSLINPRTYVLHLAEDGFSPNEENLRIWEEKAISLVELLCSKTKIPNKIAIENLYYPWAFHKPIIKKTGCSYALDVGHLWNECSVNWLGAVKEMLPQASQLHLHGVGKRDHDVLSNNCESQLTQLLHLLLEENFTGVVTCEVFGYEKTNTSLNYLRSLWGKLSLQQAE